MSGGEVRVRPLEPASPAEIDLVAHRMRLTLCEVLGEKRGAAMYTLDWLRDRVRWHLDPERAAEVYLAESPSGQLDGHAIVRVEEEDDATFGLFSTIYVDPAARRRGVATALLRAGEAWFTARALTTAVTYTDQHNHKLIELFGRHGYGLSPATSDMVRLARSLA